VCEEEPLVGMFAFLLPYLVHHCQHDAHQYWFPGISHVTICSVSVNTLTCHLQCRKIVKCLRKHLIQLNEQKSMF
jgi:hypothetical protein